MRRKTSRILSGLATGVFSLLLGSSVFAYDWDNNPPGSWGGRGTNWENPPGRVGGPGASPNRWGWRERDNNPPGSWGGRGTNWENPPGRVGGPGVSPNRWWRRGNPPGPIGGPGRGPYWRRRS